MQSNRKISIQFIASEAGVSIATVSRIINNKGTIKAETRDKVLKVLNQYNYQPKQETKLASKQKRALLVCVPDFRNPFNAPLIEGIHECAAEHGYYCLVSQVRDTANCEEIIKKNTVAGVIAVTVSDTEEFIQRASLYCPVVLCSADSEKGAMSSVNVDNYQSARKAVEYLLSCGRDKIALFNGSLRYKYARDREKAYRDALASSGLAVNEDWILNLSSFNTNLTVPNIQYVLNQPNPPNAVFAVSDIFALSTIQAAKSLNINVPQDLAVVGFDNINLTTITTPTITTVSQPGHEMGFQVCEMLMELISKPDTPIKTILLDTELILRDSTHINVKNNKT